MAITAAIIFVLLMLNALFNLVRHRLLRGFPEEK